MQQAAKKKGEIKRKFKNTRMQAVELKRELKHVQAINKEQEAELHAGRHHESKAGSPRTGAIPCLAIASRAIARNSYLHPKSSSTLISFALISC